MYEFSGPFLLCAPFSRESPVPAAEQLRSPKGEPAASWPRLGNLRCLWAAGPHLSRGVGGLA